MRDGEQTADKKIALPSSKPESPKNVVPVLPPTEPLSIEKNLVGTSIVPSQTLTSVQDTSGDSTEGLSVNSRVIPESPVQGDLSEARGSVGGSENLQEDPNASSCEIPDSPSVQEGLSRPHDSDPSAEDMSPAEVEYFRLKEEIFSKIKNPEDWEVCTSRNMH